MEELPEIPVYTKQSTKYATHWSSTTAYCLSIKAWTGQRHWHEVLAAGSKLRLFQPCRSLCNLAVSGLVACRVSDWSRFALVSVAKNLSQWLWFVADLANFDTSAYAFAAFACSTNHRTCASFAGPMFCFGSSSRNVGVLTLTKAVEVKTQEIFWNSSVAWFDVTQLFA